MTDELLNGAGDGIDSAAASTDQQIEKPVSIRDSLRAAMDGNNGDASAAVAAAPAADRKRDDAGRFAKDDTATQQAAAAKPAQAQQPQAAAQPGQQQPAADQQAAASTSTARVPPGWSPEAKAQFASLPPEVQAAVTKREQEIDNGFRVLQDYKGLEEFTPAIKAGNTTHADVMRRALDYEKSLQANPIGMVFHVARIGGINIQNLAKAIVEGKIQLPQEQPLQQPQPRPQPQTPINVEQTVEQVLRKRDVDTQVNAFLNDPANVHAQAVMDDMVTLINSGRATSLKDAYDAACWMNPDIRQQLISQAAPTPQTTTPAVNPQAQKAAAADQARKASRSLAGSSAPGPTQDHVSGKPLSIRDQLRSAMASSAGQV